MTPDNDHADFTEPTPPSHPRGGSALRGLVTALRLLTALPVPGAEADRVGHAQPWFPVVGLILGGLVFAAARAIFWATGGWSAAAALAAVAASTWLTRGLHLDGLSDCADGFGGGFTRERVLAIMKDSRVGAFGVIALILALLAKWVALDRLIERGAWGWLVGAFVISRAAQAMLAANHPYARPEGGTGKDFVDQATAANALIAAGVAGVALLLLPDVGWRGLPALAAALGAVELFGLWCRRRVGGVTGDLLGTGSELTELLVLFMGALAAGGA